MTTTTDITVIGLGAMGSALARAQLRAGYTVTVWNRDPLKAEPLAAEGAIAAASCAEAIAASPVVLVCLTTYEAADCLLSADPVRDHFAGRTVIQVSTGTPKEARTTAAWLAEAGASYIDASVKAYPEEVGRPDMLIFAGGAPDAFARAEPHLRAAGGDLRYLGDNVAAAAALDLGSLALSIALYVGVAQGARICTSEGVRADLLAQMVPFGEKPRDRAEIIHAGAYKLGSLRSGASLAVWSDVVDLIRKQARDSGISPELPDLLAKIYHRALDEGHGSEDVAALYKVLGR